jgi:toxin FitB
MFAQRILAIAEDIMLRWLLLVEEGRKTGYTYSQPDLIIAATALHHDLTVATRNTSDFTRAGVSLLDPWTDRATTE